MQWMWMRQSVLQSAQNRWHPDIPFAGTIKNGETVKIQCVDWTGGQISQSYACTYPEV